MLARFLAAPAMTNEESGQTLAEYSLLLALIAVVALLALAALGAAVSGNLDAIANAL